jgi:phage recombination protein Bet
MTTQMVTYKANNQEIKLSEGIVQQFVTKGNGQISQQEAVNFIQLCRYAELNPFLNEAYLIKFGTQPAQMVVGKETYMKRANRNQNFDGYEAGIVVQRGDEYVQRFTAKTSVGQLKLK